MAEQRCLGNIAIVICTVILLVAAAAWNKTTEKRNVLSCLIGWLIILAVVGGFWGLIWLIVRMLSKLLKLLA